MGQLLFTGNVTVTGGGSFNIEDDFGTGGLLKVDGAGITFNGSTFVNVNNTTADDESAGLHVDNGATAVIGNATGPTAVWASNGGSATAEKATETASGYYAVYAEDGGSATINGDVTATANASAVGVFTDAGSTASVAGDITANYAGIWATGASTVTANTVTAPAAGLYGVYLSDSTGTGSTVNILGNVDTTANPASTGVYLTSAGVVTIEGQLLAPAGQEILSKKIKLSHCPLLFPPL